MADTNETSDYERVVHDRETFTKGYDTGWKDKYHDKDYRPYNRDDPAAVEAYKAKEAAEFRRDASLIAAYIICAFLVFGWTYNRPQPAQPNEAGRIVFSMIGGALWPVWALGNFSIWVTKWP